MATKRPPIDPLEGPKIVLAGDVVTMDDQLTVIRGGKLFIEKGAIVAVQAAGAPAPAGFETVPVVATGGTIYPGLIELHNHLSYNVLPLWQVPKKYSNRDQWSGTPEYRKLVSGPMTVMGKSPGLLPALVRYVEAKCLLGGVTTSQGIALFSNAGVRRFYRGIVRNVEATDDADLPEAATRIADVEAQDANAFLGRLKRESCFLLHLSEGTNPAAREHFLALQVAAGQWAITRALAGIHCAALAPADFAVLGQLGGAMIWSPLSNLLLYGATADIKAARASNVRVGIGSDWSPSGSKNLLGELKVAFLVGQQVGGIDAADVVAMATRNAARILGWDKAIGTLEAGKRADLLVIDGISPTPYEALVRAKETDLALVMINGVARFGRANLMKALAANGEQITVGGQARMVFFVQETQDPDVAAIGLGDAQKKLKSALARLPALAAELEKPKPVARLRARPEPVVWQLALDELTHTGVDLRHHLPSAKGRKPTGATRVAAASTKKLSEILEPVDLDPLTVADDADFLASIGNQKNLPAFVRDHLAALYS
jgi:cytosine/adenosine deaminase-related metal-dependent hydrolase